MELKRQVSRLFDACTGMHQHQPAELLRWLVGDVLAGFGIDTNETPPPELSGWLRAQTSTRAW